MSRRVGYPGWVKLLEPMRAELGIDDTDDMPLLAQYFRRRIPRRPRSSRPARH
jgi:hypothetical protein